MRIELERCEGCGDCIDRCPVKAIRISDGKKAVIGEECIDCGQCAKTCPQGAPVAVTGSLHGLSGYAYGIALVAPSLEVLLDSESFGRRMSPEDLGSAFLSLGFDEIFEVARAARIVAFLVEKNIRQDGGAKPLFTSSCPAALRLIQRRFPGLTKYIARVLSPMEVAARLAKEAAAKKTGLPLERIGAFFISPCPAKVTEKEQPILTRRSAVDQVVGINSLYGSIVDRLAIKASQGRHPGSRRGVDPQIEAGCPAETARNEDPVTRMRVSGIPAMTDLLEEIERGRPVGADLIELHACAGGCLGGALNPRNPLMGAPDIGRLVSKYRRNRYCFNDRYLQEIYSKGCFASAEPVPPIRIGSGEPNAVRYRDHSVTAPLTIKERL